jgi:hypothetical protein
MAGCTVPHQIFRSEARRRVKAGALNLIHREALSALMDAVERTLTTDGMHVLPDLYEHFQRTVSVLSHSSEGSR